MHNIVLVIGRGLPSAVNEIVESFGVENMDIERHERAGKTQIIFSADVYYRWCNPAALMGNISDLSVTNHPMLAWASCFVAILPFALSPRETRARAC